MIQNIMDFLSELCSGFSLESKPCPVSLVMHLRVHIVTCSHYSDGNEIETQKILTHIAHEPDHFL